MDKEDNSSHLDIRSIIELLWSERRFIFRKTSYFAIFSVIYALSISNMYTSTAVLAESEKAGSPMLLENPLSSRNIGLFGESTFNSSEAVIILNSWKFISDFLKEHKLEIDIYAGNSLDKKTGLLEIDDDVYDASSETWVFNWDNEPPTDWKLYKRFIKNFYVVYNKQDSTIQVSYTSYSPTFAKYIVDEIIYSLNDHLREKKLDQVNKNIEYLNLQISNTSNASMKEYFFGIIEQQTREKMLAAASIEYAFTTINPAMVEEMKSYPSRSFICIFITILGGILICGYVLLDRYKIVDFDPLRANLVQFKEFSKINIEKLKKYLLNKLKR